MATQKKLHTVVDRNDSLAKENSYVNFQSLKEKVLKDENPETLILQGGNDKDCSVSRLVCLPVNQ